MKLFAHPMLVPKSVPKSKRVGFAKRGDAVTVLSEIAGRNWLEVETIDGRHGFIFGDLIKPAA